MRGPLTAAGWQVQPDRAWVSAHHRGRALLHRVDSRIGLTDRDFAVLDEWLRVS
ncbi:hypothetical protein [Amycolatopsis rhizosphaerae]|uniref:hypothetical protein n=1 Tax=Amycolatopsis rhizosphaerae TaxID=2053003 RepID=UPI001643D6D2|nr:hypothetical protein [Amycolatopsis rhizosphaerae]